MPKEADMAAETFTFTRYPANGRIISLDGKEMRLKILERMSQTHVIRITYSAS